MSEVFDPETGAMISQAEPEEEVVRLDFQLNARESAEYVAERLGHFVSAGAFRQLVMNGEAPAPITGNDFKAVWSQAALSAWTAERLEAEEDDSEAGEAGPEKEEPQHEDVYEFFEKTYSPYYELHILKANAREAGTPVMVWCEQWWLHKSVVARLVAAWYAWEDAFAAGGGAMSSWILEHADRHFERIMADTGPFRKCKTGHTEDVGEYPTTPCPPTLRLQDDEETLESKETQQ